MNLKIAPTWSKKEQGEEMKNSMNDSPCYDLNDFVKAMADETRQRILTLLKEGELNVSELQENFDLTQPTISHHLAILKHARLVVERHEGRMTYYRANPACVAVCCQEILDRFKLPAHQ